MKRKHKIRYEVSSFGHTMWCNKYKRWLNMNDPLYAEPDHKGYSSHKSCKTLKQALHLCAALDVVANKGKDVFILRFTYPKGKRKIDEFTFIRR